MWILPLPSCPFPGKHRLGGRLLCHRCTSGSGCKAVARGWSCCTLSEKERRWSQLKPEPRTHQDPKAEKHTSKVSMNLPLFGRDSNLLAGYSFHIIKLKLCFILCENNVNTMGTGSPGVIYLQIKTKWKQTITESRKPRLEFPVLWGVSTWFGKDLWKEMTLRQGNPTCKPGQSSPGFLMTPVFELSHCVWVGGPEPIQSPGSVRLFIRPLINRIG